MPLLGVSIIHADINFMCEPDRWNSFREDRSRRHKCHFSNLPALSIPAFTGLLKMLLHVW